MLSRRLRKSEIPGVLNNAPVISDSVFHFPQHCCSSAGNFYAFQNTGFFLYG
jgi:hypothetical protein